VFDLISRQKCHDFSKAKRQGPGERKKGRKDSEKAKKKIERPHLYRDEKKARQIAGVEQIGKKTGGHTVATPHRMPLEKSKKGTLHAEKRRGKEKTEQSKGGRGGKEGKLRMDRSPAFTRKICREKEGTRLNSHPIVIREKSRAKRGRER